MTLSTLTTQMLADIRQLSEAQDHTLATRDSLCEKTVEEKAHIMNEKCNCQASGHCTCGDKCDCSKKGSPGAKRFSCKCGDNCLCGNNCQCDK